MIFIDSNIPMYILGAAHPNKELARRALERSITEREVLVTDAEVLQEILHRYAAIDRRDAIEVAFELLLGVVDDVFPTEVQDVQLAKRIVLTSDRLSPRDAIHLAVMQRRAIVSVLTFDRAFDAIPGIKRIAE